MRPGDFWPISSCRADFDGVSGSDTVTRPQSNPWTTPPDWGILPQDECAAPWTCQDPRPARRAAAWTAGGREVPGDGDRVAGRQAVHSARRSPIFDVRREPPMVDPHDGAPAESRPPQPADLIEADECIRHFLLHVRLRKRGTIHTTVSSGSPSGARVPGNLSTPARYGRTGWAEHCRARPPTDWRKRTRMPPTSRGSFSGTSAWLAHNERVFATWL